MINNAALDQQRAQLMQFVASNPADAVARRALAATMVELGQMRSAQSWLKEAVSLEPYYAEAWLDLGKLNAKLGDKAGAHEAYGKAVNLVPGYRAAEDELAAFVRSAGLPMPERQIWPKPRTLTGSFSADPAAREADMRATLAADRADTGALLQLALLLLSRNRVTEAELFARHVLATQPGEVTAGLTLVSVLQMRGLWDDAVTQALAISDRAPAHPVAAVIAFFAALDGCRWTKFIERKARAANAVCAQPQITEPMDCAHLGLSAAEIAEVARAYAARFSGAEPVAARPRADGGKIRLGYISADFHDHPVGRIAAQLITHHDRTRFTVKGYALWPATDHVRASITRACDEFVDLYSVDADAAARQIDVDVLIDLSGYTKNARPEILARRPAPVQVNYLGFPGTMGADFIDILLADATVAGGLVATERVVELPRCLLPAFSYRGHEPAAMTRAGFGLPPTGPVLCNFGETRRITPDQFAIWMRLLKQLPDAVLWLAQPRGEAGTRLKIAAVEHGVGAHRLHFAARAPVAEYLARYTVADVFLDTAPVNAQSTAADALWMGCPVVTQLGEIYPGRVAASLLRASGLGDLVAHDAAGYEATVSQAVARTRELREHLRGQRGGNALFNPALFVRDLEAAYVGMLQSTR